MGSILRYPCQHLPSQPRIPRIPLCCSLYYWISQHLQYCFDWIPQHLQLLQPPSYWISQHLQNCFDWIPQHLQLLQPPCDWISQHLQHCFDWISQHLQHCFDWISQHLQHRLYWISLYVQGCPLQQSSSSSTQSCLRTRCSKGISLLENNLSSKTDFFQKNFSYQKKIPHNRMFILAK